MNKKIVLIVVFLICSSAVNSQEIYWSLTKCMDVALQNNIEIKIGQLEISRTQRSRNSVVNRMLPVIHLYGEQIYNFGSTINPATNGRVSSNIQNDNFYLSARTNLIDFSAFANARKDKINIEVSKAEKEVVENEYKLQILDSYYQALYTQELLKIQKEQLKQASFNLDRVNKEVTIGSKPQSDLYDMQLSFSEEENRILETTQLYAVRKTQLFQLMNLVAIAIDEVLLEVYPIKTKTDNFAGKLQNPKIRLAELNYQNSLRSIYLEKTNNLPVLSAYYGYSTFYYKTLNQGITDTDPFFTQIEGNKSQQLGMQLDIPIFNGFRNNKKISVSKIESKKTKLAMEKEKQELDKQVVLEEQNKRNYLQLQQKLQERQIYAKASLTTNQAKFVSGKVEAILYSAVKNQFLTAEYELLKNKLQLQYIDLKINLLKNNEL
jgi:outer membrane protein